MTDEMKIRQAQVLQQRITIEQSILGMALLKSDVANQISMNLTPEMFDRPIHRIIFSAIIKSNQKISNPDILAVYNEIVADHPGEVQIKYLLDLADSQATTANLDYYMTELKAAAEKYRLRNYALQLISEIDHSEDYEPGYLETKKKEFLELGFGMESVSILTPAQLAKGYMDHIEKISKGELKPLFTGFPGVDKTIMGLQPGYLILIGGRPSVGKTALALNMAYHLSFEKQIPVLFLSLEMGKNSIVERYVTRQKKIGYYKLRYGKIEDPEDWKSLSLSMNSLSNSKFYMVDQSSITLPQIESIISHAIRQYAVQAVFIDYIGLISIAGRSRVEEIGTISRELKAAAKRNNLPIVALSQLSREGDEGFPKLKHLRDSGNLEQDADVVIFVHRERQSDGTLKNEGIISIAKARNEETANIRVIFKPEQIQFFEQAREDDRSRDQSEI